MGQTKLTVHVPGLAPARELADRLVAAEDPSALAVTLFEVTGKEAWQVDAYYESPPDAAAVLMLVAGASVLPDSLVITEVPDENWVAISQSALPPVEAGRFIVHGSHDRDRIGVRLTALEIDAGEAFGTAHHATTRGCLEAIDRLTRRRHFRRVHDLGCGSGVLAIAARRLLPRAIITASDNDSEAVRVARGNVRTNRVGTTLRIVTAQGFAHSSLRGPQLFDLVVANILAGPLIRLAGPMRHALRRRGIAVLSGILAEQAAVVAAAYRSQGFVVATATTEAGWTTMTLVTGRDRPKTSLSPRALKSWRRRRNERGKRAGRPVIGP